MDGDEDGTDEDRTAVEDDVDVDVVMGFMVVDDRVVVDEDEVGVGRVGSTEDGLGCVRGGLLALSPLEPVKPLVPCPSPPLARTSTTSTTTCQFPWSSLLLALALVFVLALVLCVPATGESKGLFER